MVIAPSTPRRSTRGTIFTPTPHASSHSRAHQPNTTYAWTSAPLPSSSTSTSSTRYNSFSRIVSRTGGTQTPTTKGGKVRAGKGDEESRFTVGDGVLVAVEGGDEGVGVLIGLWEEPEDGENAEDEDGEQEQREEEEEEGERGPKMMAEIHWAFRKQDLPGIMKNVQVDENEVLLAASALSRPVTSHIPIHFLLRTIPIYSKAFYREQFPETKSKVKGWSYIRQGVYWCHRAFDKFAKGGKAWRVDIDDWREGGKKGYGWKVKGPTEISHLVASDDEAPSDEDEGSEAEMNDGEESEDELAMDVDEEETFEPPSKRKRPTTTAGRKAARGGKRVKPDPKSRPIKGRPPLKGKRMPHPTSSTSNLPSSILSPEQLPVDPYERALRLLHVGATPESLPCREEEFVDVLGKVEEGVESGGGGCLYIAGVPGTGKTATVHAVVKELKRKAEDGELPPFSYVEINGLKIPSPQHAYTVLWEAISGAKGVSAKTALRGLEGHFGRKVGGGVRGPRGHTFVVLMDELDQLLTAKQDVVYNFFNWPTMRDSQLFVIAVANRMDLPQHLAAKIKSRIGLQTILFQPYDRAALISIVQSRLISHPLTPSADPKVLLPDAIGLAAVKMAGTNGDARRVLDACRRAVEVALENKNKPLPTTTGGLVPSNGNRPGEPHPVTAKEMHAVLQAMSSSPVAKFIGGCSIQQKMMLAALVRCVRREGIPEIAWRNVRSDHDALSRSLVFDPTSTAGAGAGAGGGDVLLSNSELALVLSSLISSHALVCSMEGYKGVDERKVALGMEVGEVGRVLMNEGEGWRRALAGV
ncbi:hypothetical protein CI109_103517 [Kwoniella shandongensis]|uniref:Origin recognition complex subunit 1 n=1 Tax=Kwoniella shandongensis TaxID=1734106 RepID=A0A5M6BW03_9TREE|nr:uncharacterized protein CI109_004581 [Kwoniella shandongensis]KAA5527046.1 hypothetical protein CI109_004581 [Kwoniella shandongensis]